MKSILKLLTLSTIIILAGCQHIKPTQDNKHPVVLTNDTSSDSTFKLIENIHQYTLDNGLKVIIKEDRRAPVVMTQIWYKVGSNDEPVGKGGISHFLEHLMFKDTPKVSGDEFSRLISRYGGSNNAYTNQDVTVYYELLPANRYAMALELEANRMQHILFKPEQIASERQVVLEERRVRTDDNPNAKALEKALAFFYGDTPRGRPVIGSVEDINNITLSDLQAWYRTWYTPSNATVVVVGDVNKDEALAYIKKYFGDIKGHDVPKRDFHQFLHADDIFVPQPNHITTRHLTIKEAVQVPSLMLAWQVPSLSSIKHTGQDSTNTRKELLALGLVDDILSGGASSRFATNLVKKELVHSAFAYINDASYGDSVFVISATPKQGVSLDDTKKLILDELEHTLTGDISDDELKRSQVGVKTMLVFGADGISGQANLLGAMSTSDLPFDYIKEEFAMMKDVKGDDIKHAGHKYLTPQRMYSIYVVPNDQN